MRHEYRLLDVFTDRAFGGNQLAVFTDAEAIDPALMQPIAKELNLSETTFVLPAKSGGTHHVRIFTPGRELPFAGHPTIGTAFTLAGGADRTYTFELAVGPIGVTVRDGFTEMEQPLPKFGDVAKDRAAVARSLALEDRDLAETPVQIVSSGVPFQFIHLRSLDAVRRARPLAAEENRYVLTTECADAGSQVHGRMFGGGGLGIAEDPATGGAHGPLGAYLVRYALAHPGKIVSEQGFEMGRPSILHVRVDGTREKVTSVHVGGNCVATGGGWIDL